MNEESLLERAPRYWIGAARADHSAALGRSRSMALASSTPFRSPALRQTRCLCHRAVIDRTLASCNKVRIRSEASFIGPHCTMSNSPMAMLGPLSFSHV